MTTLKQSLAHTPVELNFGTSGLRDLVTNMTDLECYINTLGFIGFLEESDSLKPDTIFFLAGDLRDSTPRIMSSVYKAVIDAGYSVQNFGHTPTPALAYYGLRHDSPSIMVTGSHIPSDRNGIKFYKFGGELLKEDEEAVKASVARVRQRIYGQDLSASIFDQNGMFQNPPELPSPSNDAGEAYIKRYTDIFSSDLFKGKTIIFYQHSSVGRDLFVDMLGRLGANVIPVDRSEVFIPIDTENVTPDNQKYFRSLAEKYPGAFAIISTDGDSDRPFVVDEKGIFHRGDELGAIVAEWLQADYAAIPISSNDGVSTYLENSKVPSIHTRIGSPYVITAMDGANASGHKRVVGWEPNGGFLLGCKIEINQGVLEELPTRDTGLPILGALAAAIESNLSLSQLFDRLPERYTSSGLIDNFPKETAIALLEQYSIDSEMTFQEIEKFFTPNKGFGKVKDTNALDGLRIYFDNGDIAHLRSSGNAPQLRIYAVASTQERADEIVRIAISEPDGIIRKMEFSFNEQV